MANSVPPLHVRIISPRQIILDTEAASVSSKNQQGKFDILPLHVNFITLIENEPIVIRKKNQKKPILLAFPIAIIVCLDNKVDIYTYINQASIAANGSHPAQPAPATQPIRPVQAGPAQKPN